MCNVANEGSSTVSVINASTHQVAGNPITGESRPNSLAYNSNNGRIYVVNYADGTHGTVSVIDTLTNTLVDTVSVGAFPQGIAYDSDNGEMYVSNFDSGTVSVIATLQYPSHTVITSATDGNDNPVQSGGSTLSTSITFNVQATAGTNPIAGFQCSLDNNAFSSCGTATNNAGTITFNNLEAGPHTVKIVAVDSQNNVDLTPATFSWTIVQPPSNTTITSAVDGNGNPVQNGISTTSTSIIFKVQATPGSNPIAGFPIAGFQCSLDNGPFSACSGTFSNNMETITFNNLAVDQQHTFKVRAVDTKGNVDPTPATFSWTVTQQSPPNNGDNGGTSTGGNGGTGGIAIARSGNANGGSGGNGGSDFNGGHNWGNNGGIGGKGGSGIHSGSTSSSAGSGGQGGSADFNSMPMF